MTLAPADQVIVLEQGGTCWAWSALEITAAYDLTRRADSVRLDPAQRLAAAVREQAAYLDRLLAVRPGEVVALRIVRTAPHALRMWLLGRVSAPDVAAATARAGELADRLAAVPAHLAVERVTQAADIQAALAP